MFQFLRKSNDIPTKMVKRNNYDNIWSRGHAVTWFTCICLVANSKSVYMVWNGTDSSLIFVAIFVFWYKHTKSSYFWSQSATHLLYRMFRMLPRKNLWETLKMYSSCSSIFSTLFSSSCAMIAFAHLVTKNAKLIWLDPCALCVGVCVSVRSCAQFLDRKWLNEIQKIC